MKKFKIWSTVEKCFYTQEHTQNFCITLEGKVACWDESQGWDDSWFKHYIPLQSSGLSDSLGNEIYEGDILIHENTEGIVKFVKGCFILELTSDTDLVIYAYNWHLEETKIIGNIYEKEYIVIKDKRGNTVCLPGDTSEDDLALWRSRK